jgi:hypothetical protein
MFHHSEFRSGLRSAVGFVALLLASVCYGQGQPPLLLQHPTLSANRIVFVYGNDLWSVSRDGGVAERLTAGWARNRCRRFLRTGARSRSRRTSMETSTCT